MQNSLSDFGWAICQTDHMTLNMNNAYGPSDIRVCETTYWDGGEWVYCHAPARERDRDGMWVCSEHAPKR